MQYYGLLRIWLGGLEILGLGLDLRIDGRWLIVGGLWSMVDGLIRGRFRIGRPANLLEGEVEIIRMMLEDD